MSGQSRPPDDMLTSLDDLRKRLYVLETHGLPGISAAPLGWYLATTIAGTGGPTALARYNTVFSSWVVDRSGSIVGVSCRLSSVRTAGTLTVEVYKNGVATGLVAVIDATHTQNGIGTQARGLDTFVAGDFIHLQYTTVGFTPTANNLIADLTVSYD